MQTVVYARRSAESGDDYSLTTQVEACQRYAAARGLADVTVVQENYTGTVPLADRPGGAAVWQAVRGRQARALVVYTLDRLSRADLVDALAMLREMMRAGCVIHTVDAGPIESLNDIGLIVRSWQSSEERRKIVDRLHRGKIGKARSGWVGDGRPPYGYDKIGVKRQARLVINEERAGIVRRMINWLLVDRVPLREIARRLNEGGVLPARGAGRWTHSTVGQVLGNPILCGLVVYATERAYLPELAIIDVDTYDRIKAVLADNRARASRNRRREYLLAGHIRCECHKSMIGLARVVGEKTYLYYRCAQWTAREFDRTCANRLAIRTEVVDGLAWSYVLACAQPEQLAAWRAELQASGTAAALAPWRARLAEIDRDIDQARRRIARVMAQFGDDRRPAVSEQRDVIIDEANALIERRTAERVQVAREAEDEAGRTARQDEALTVVARLRRKLEHATPAQRRQVVQVIDLRVTVRAVEDGREIRVASLIGPERVFRVR